MTEHVRCLSLLSASTEIVHRLGCAHLLVGRSHGCDDPPLATVLPIATAPKVDPNAPSRDLDEAVRVQAATGGPIYHIHNELVRSLAPTVIITQEQCRICAVTPEDVAGVCAKLPVAATVVTIKPTTLDDVMGDVLTIAGALGVPERGTKLVRMLRARLASLTALTACAPAHRPKVAHVEWLAPLMGSGYWIAECFEAANCEMVHGTRGGHSHTLASEALLAEAEVLLLAPCGFSIERTHAELRALPLLASAAWRALPAVASGRVAVADGNLYFNRSSCGVLETAEIAAEVAHDEARGLFGHHGKRWVWLSELDAFCARDGAPPPIKKVAVAEAAEVVPPSKAAPRMPPPRPPPGEVGGPTTPSAHVRAQLEALRRADFDAAFAFNSQANRLRLGGVAEFEQIVRGSDSFCALADPQADLGVAEAAPPGPDAGCDVQVTARSAGQVVRFRFDVSRGAAEGAWETDGVRIEC